MTRLLPALLLLVCGQVFAACPQVYNGVSYPCTIAAGSLSGSTYRESVDAATWETVVFPRGNGDEVASLSTARFFPGRNQSMQMQLFIDVEGNQMKMVHVKDNGPITEQYKQEWRLETTQTTAPCTNTVRCLRVVIRDPVVPPMDVITFSTTTDWKVAAQYYKDWARQQWWYRSHGRLAGKRVGCFMTQYRTNEFDKFYPDFECAGATNCPAWFQSLKNSGNAFGLPYINGALWSREHAGYDVANIAQDSNGKPIYYSNPSSWAATNNYALNAVVKPTTANINGWQYKVTTDNGSSGASEPTWPTTLGGTVADGDLVWTAQNTLLYVDPLLPSWPATLRAQFDALQATDGSTSEGIYIDVSAAADPIDVYYSGSPNYAAYILGVAAVLSEFDHKIIMAEGLAEIYIPYVDIALISPPRTEVDTAIGLFGFVYGDVKDLAIVGYTTNSGDNDAALYDAQFRAMNTFRHDALYFSGGGVTLEAYLNTLPSTNHARLCMAAWSNSCSSAARAAASSRPAASNRTLAAERAAR